MKKAPRVNHDQGRRASGCDHAWKSRTKLPISQQETTKKPERFYLIWWAIIGEISAMLIEAGQRANGGLIVVKENTRRMVIRE